MDIGNKFKYIDAVILKNIIILLYLVRKGFEPLIRFHNTRFPGVLLKPLGHLT